MHIKIYVTPLLKKGFLVDRIYNIKFSYAVSGVHFTSDTDMQFPLYHIMLYLFLLNHYPVISDSVLSDSLPSYIRFRFISFHFSCSIRFPDQIWGYI